MDDKKPDNLKRQIATISVIIVSLLFSIVALTYSWYVSSSSINANHVTITASNDESEGDTLGITTPDSQAINNKIIVNVEGLMIATPGKIEEDTLSDPDRYYFDGKWFVRSPTGLKEQDDVTGTLPDEPYTSASSSTSNSSSNTSASTTSSTTTSSSSLTSNSNSNLTSSSNSSSANAIIKNDKTSILTCFYYDLHLYVRENNPVHTIFCTPTLTNIAGETEQQTLANTALYSSIRYAVEMVNVYDSQPGLVVRTPWLLFNNDFSLYNSETKSFSTYSATTSNWVVAPKSQVRVLLWIDAQSSSAVTALSGKTHLELSFDFTSGTK